MNSEHIMLCEINLAQNNKYCVIPLASGTQSRQSQRQEVEWWVLEAERGKKDELLFNRYGVSVWIDENF